MSDETIRYWGTHPEGFPEGYVGYPFFVGRPIKVFESLENVTQIVAGGQHCLFVQEDGTVLLWGSKHEYGDGLPILDPRPLPEVGQAELVAAGVDNSFIINRSGEAWAFGGNERGALGDGTNVARHEAVRVPALDGSKALAIGLLHGLALRADGTVLAWGRGGSGQLGDGLKEDRFQPLPVPGLDRVSAVAARGQHSLALREDGTVWSWGSGEWGQVGNGQTTGRASPGQIDGLPSVAAIASGSSCSYALTTDGTLYAWGLNDRGQLGLGGEIREDPVDLRSIPALTRAPSLASLWSGFATVHARTLDGDWYAWGANIFAQVGDGTHKDRSVPREISEK